MSGGMSGEWRYGEGWINTDQLNSKATSNGAVKLLELILLCSEMMSSCYAALLIKCAKYTQHKPYLV